ncbi:MAG: hypothetical protein M5R36_06540 [Deltaproteobacteria bacterium]|nr:hypothetical protein [Deltaproteobacteria bacterium]
MSGKSFAEGGASTFVLGAVFAGLYVIRRPDMVFYPQLWAEDGGFFLHAALTGKMLREFNGYFHLAPQAAAWLASLVPRYAPHVITAIAVLIHVLTGLYFVSPRFAFLLEKRLHRILMVVLFTLGHTCWETRGNMANIQWLLLVLLALVVADHWNAETSGGMRSPSRSCLPRGRSVRWFRRGWDCSSWRPRCARSG